MYFLKIITFKVSSKDQSCSLNSLIQQRLSTSYMPFTQASLQQRFGALELKGKRLAKLSSPVLYLSFTPSLSSPLFVLSFQGKFWSVAVCVWLKDITSAPTGVTWGRDRRLDVVVTMVTSGWGAWALSPCGLVLVISLSVCLSQQPYVKPIDCNRKEHPVTIYQGEFVKMSELFFTYHPSIHSEMCTCQNMFEKTRVGICINVPHSGLL